MVEGQRWTALAAAIKADESFASLPQHGAGAAASARVRRYTWRPARPTIPGDPPRRLLLVRDVTAAHVADQTIRSLFKFLQDRDEDRTRVLRRTNAAIEAERNRIARDLHDGPVQGVSARLALAGSGAADAEGRGDGRGYRDPLQGPQGALGGGGQSPAANVGPAAAPPGGAGPRPGAPRDARQVQAGDRRRDRARGRRERRDPAGPPDARLPHRAGGARERRQALEGGPSWV